MRKELFLGALVFLSACIGPVIVESQHPWDEETEESQRTGLKVSASEIARQYRYRIGERKFSHDCSGFIGAILYQNGIDVFKGATVLEMKGYGVQLLHEYTLKYGRLFKENPGVGDLIFFSNTYDRNHDRKYNDRLTHIGMIEKIDADGTITFIHHLNSSAQEDTMNLQSPFVHERNQKELNSYLRKRHRGDAPGTHYLAGQLFSGFGSLVREKLDESAVIQ